MTTAANQQVEQLSREELLALVIRQQEVIARLETEVAALKAELEKFRRPPTPSRNSSQPPSLDQKANSDSQRRTSVIHRKVTNCFRSEWGAKAYAALQSVIATARLKGENIFDALVKLMGKPIDRYLQPSSP